MPDTIKIPLTVVWLSEHDLLIRAANMLGYAVPCHANTNVPQSSSKGVLLCRKANPALGADLSDCVSIAEWTSSLEFTIAQLIELDVFDLGALVYCSHDTCRLLQAHCEELRS